MKPLSFNFNVSGSDHPLTAHFPNVSEVNSRLDVIKKIFTEAFITAYTVYHKSSQSTETIETWLKLKPGLSLQQWLDNTFTGEYHEFLQSKKVFVFLCSANEDIIGWMTCAPVSPNGDLYLSQSALAAEWRHKKVASEVLANCIKHKTFIQFFLGVKNVKVITRKINEIAQRLFAGAGFIRDETIDPEVYGDEYDDRYVGFRLPVS